MRVCSDDESGSYTFRCPTCAVAVAKGASKRIVDLLVSWGEPRYRAEQVRAWVYQNISPKLAGKMDVNLLRGLYLNDPDTYAAFRERTPVVVLAGSLWVFDVTD